jgi:RNA polymerase sigma-70 factor (ECF subfamily)
MSPCLFANDRLARSFARTGNEGKVLDTRQALDTFLGGVEQRAYRLAHAATGHPEEALDLVQEAMLTLVKRYAQRDPAEWGALFHRILQNRIRDWYRRQKVRNRLRVWFGGREDEPDPVETAVDTHSPGPAQSLANRDLGQALQAALHSLPLRQQQTFLLRAWEGLDVKATARALGISDGSVKTHYSRAVQALREKLGDQLDDG